MKKISLVGAGLAALFALSGCGAGGPSTPTPGGTGGPSVTPASQYPRTGHSPDYSWVAGRVTFTKIQGGCIFIYTDPAEISALEKALTPQPVGSPVSGPTVGTAVQGDTSPPLSEITPQTGPAPTEPPGTRLSPGGPGWDPSQVKDGEYVILFGRLAGPDDPREICPGGTPYVVDRVQTNP